VCVCAFVPRDKQFVCFEGESSEYG